MGGGAVRVTRRGFAPMTLPAISTAWPDGLGTAYNRLWRAMEVAMFDSVIRSATVIDGLAVKAALASAAQ